MATKKRHRTENYDLSKRRIERKRKRKSFNLFSRHFPPRTLRHTLINSQALALYTISVEMCMNHTEKLPSMLFYNKFPKRWR